MTRTTLAERRARRAETVTIPVRLAALREDARDAVINSYSATWLSTGGVPYRKTAAQRQIDHIKARLLCEVLADYMNQGEHGTPTGMHSDLLHEALASGQIVDTGRSYTVPGETDSAWVESLTVRTIP